MRLAFALIAALSLSDCSTGVRVQTQNLASTIASVQYYQIIENILRIYDDMFALPSQFELGGGSAQNSHQLTTGLLDGFNFTSAPAISGLSLTGGMTAQNSWAVNPVSNVSDLRRLQAVYRHVISRNNDSTRGKFLDLQKQWNRIAGQSTDRTDTYAFDVAQAVGDLPDDAFVYVIGLNETCPSGVSERYLTRRVCFHDGSLTRHDSQGREITETLTAADLRARLIFWLAAASQVPVVNGPDPKVERVGVVPRTPGAAQPAPGSAPASVAIPAQRLQRSFNIEQRVRPDYVPNSSIR